MDVKDLKVGDKIRIVGVPGEGVPDYTLHPSTRRVYQKLVARRRAVRISEIDAWGVPRFWCRFRRKTGGWEWHAMSVAAGDPWVRVVPRKKTKEGNRKNGFKRT